MSTTNESRLNSLFQTMSMELLQLSINDESKQFAVDRLKNRMRKRAKYLRPDLDSIALAKFCEINKIVGATEISLSQETVNNARLFITTIFERFNSSLNETNIQVSLDKSYLLSLWRFGPGASNGIKGTHCAEKITQKMTCTSSAIPLVTQLRRSNPYFRAFDTLKETEGYDLYNGSKLTTVPKNEDTVRVIAIEPSGNMALQLAAGQYITDVLKRIGLDISTQQPKNKRLAEIASIDNSLATIDLKSASDMFCPELIRLLMPTEWFELLMQIRSPVTAINGVDVELKMISTMGNGFTFPLMTLILVSLIYANRCRDPKSPLLWVDWTNTAVFGDDIIIPVGEYVSYTQLLSEAGLIVNHDKSYSDGPFRESCGGDYFRGYNVTPFYVRSLSSDSEIFVAINQVLEWCAYHKIFLTSTLLLLRSFLQKVFFVPEWSNPDQGILCTQVESRYKFLQPEQHLIKLSDQFFLMPLAVGGFVFSRGSDVYYAPRQYKPRYVVRKGRLPKGYLSGHDPSKRSITTSSAIDLLVSLVFKFST